MARGKCNHDPQAPRLALAVPRVDKSPHFIREAGARSDRFYFYPRNFPELTGHSIAGPAARIRERRSPRREAWALMGKAIIRHTDRRTLRIGDQRPDGLCNGVSIARYMEETGLSRYRVARVLRDFEEAGYIETHVQPVEEKKDPKTGASILDAKGKKTYRGFAAQRTVCPRLLSRLAFLPKTVEKARAAGAAAWRKLRQGVASAVAILGTRRALRKLAGGGAAELSPAAAPALPRPPKGTDQGDANRAREARLATFYADSGPHPKPPGSR